MSCMLLARSLPSACRLDGNWALPVPAVSQHHLPGALNAWCNGNGIRVKKPHVALIVLELTLILEIFLIEVGLSNMMSN